MRPGSPVVGVLVGIAQVLAGLVCVAKRNDAGVDWVFVGVDRVYVGFDLLHVGVGAVLNTSGLDAGVLVWFRMLSRGLKLGLIVI